MAQDPGSRTEAERYNLAEAQLHYAIEGEIGDFKYKNPDPLIKAIETAVQKLPSRIQYLVEDLSILHQQGYLDDGTREAIHEEYDVEEPIDIAEELIQIERKDPLYHPPLAVSGVTRDTFNTMELGVHLGHILHTIDENSETDLHHPALMCGFMLGLAGKWFDDKHGVDQIGLWMKQLNGPLSEEMNNIETTQKKLLKAVDRTTEEIGLHGEIASRLRKTGFEPVLPLVVEVYHEIASEVYDEIGDSTFIAPSDIENLPLDDLIYPVVADLKASDRISKAEALAEAVLTDVEVLAEKTWKQDMCEIDVLAANWLPTTSLTTDTDSSIKLLNDKFQRASTNIEGKHLNDLSGVGTSPEPWDDYPLVKETSGELTYYGDFLGHIVAGWKLTYIDYPLVEQIDTEELHVFYPDEERLVYVPDEVDALTACYAFALDHLDGRQDYNKLFENAYDQRLNS
ncbi:hypothetical protein G6M89_14790 [Natronolimnobius sp. AArcel1]|uniref:hypothetical protein n=1 Tax=Natronolimnobius sp. AArcel1 TaxID=1679093 RepID=UPI0013EAECA5|nr:hypothetical protein [Natronolimnobius sp. AArcel1]NGM70261.1 hypothetical protein [Natronolimnobius sp. AArcel1]